MTNRVSQKDEKYNSYNELKPGDIFTWWEDSPYRFDKMILDVEDGRGIHNFVYLNSGRVNGGVHMVRVKVAPKNSMVTLTIE